MILWGKELFSHSLKTDSSLSWWLHHGNDNIELNLSDYKSLGINLTFCDEDATLSLGFILFTFNLVLNTPMVLKLSNWLCKSKRSKYDAGNRAYGLSVSASRIEFQFHSDGTGMSDVSGLSYSLWADDLFKNTTTVEVIKQESINQDINFTACGEQYRKDNAGFDVKVERYTARYKFIVIPIPFYREVNYRVDVKCIGFMIGYQGKGENSWDCGDDGTEGISFPIPSSKVKASEAVTAMLNKVRRTVIKRGAIDDKFPSTNRED